MLSTLTGVKLQLGQRWRISEEAAVRAARRTNVNLFFNAVSWLAILVVIACGCYFVSLGVMSLAVKAIPALHGILEVTVIGCSTILTLVVMAGVTLFLGGRRG
jgi:hypothetical protein